MKRIGIAFFYHESHSFTPMITTLDHFYNEAYVKGEEIFEHYTGTRTEVGGFIDYFKEKTNSVELVPLLCAAATPSGVVIKEAYNKIESDFMKEISRNLPLDGVLLALHGAMVVEGLHDPEEKLLKEIRKLIGNDVPIATTLDLHANISENMFKYTPLHFGFKTYPHIDMYEQGIKAASVIEKCLFKNTSFKSVYKRLPMLLPSLNMRTSEGPMKEMVELAKRYELQEGIESISVFGGFPYADTPSSSASIVAVGVDEKKLIKVTDVLADKYWSLKDKFIVQIPSAEEGLKIAMDLKNTKPVVLADISDNPLSCGSGDTTELLRVMLSQNLEDALFGGLYDLESINKCQQVGEGRRVKLQLGGKITPQFGEPIEVEAKVIKLSDGVFYNSGPFNKSLKVDLKAAAHIEVNGLDVVLIGRPMSANDPEMFRHLDIEPANKKILGLKAKNHFRAAFDPIIDEVIYIDAPGVSTNDLSKLEYKYIKRPIWPLDKID